MIKIGLVYTSTTPELIELVEKEVKDQIGSDVEMLSYQDPTILAEARENGYVTTQAAARLFSMFMKAAQDGAEAILNICSSVGEAADSMQDAAKYIGVPIVRIDEEMCYDAIRKGQRIGVLATLPTTMEPTKNTLLRVGRELGRHPILVENLIDGAFGADQEQFKKMILAKAKEIQAEVDVLVFCQGSMAYCEQYVEQELGITTLSSPRYGAKALREALINLGKIEG